MNEHLRANGMLVESKPRLSRRGHILLFAFAAVVVGLGFYIKF